MLSLLALTLAASQQRTPAVDFPLEARKDARLSLLSFARGAAAVTDRDSSNWWVIDSYPLSSSLRKPEFTVDLGGLDLVAIGLGQCDFGSRFVEFSERKWSTAALAVDSSNASGHQRVSILEIRRAVFPLSNPVTATSLLQLKSFDLDHVAKKAIAANAPIGGAVAEELAATTFRVVKGHVGTLGSNGPTTAFLGIKSASSRFTGVLIVSIGGEAPSFLPCNRADSFAVLDGWNLIRTVGRRKMVVTYFENGKWVPEAESTLPVGSVVRSAIGSSSVLFTVVGDNSAVWTTGFYPEFKNRRVATPVSNDRLVFSWLYAYWLEGNVVKRIEIF